MPTAADARARIEAIRARSEWVDPAAFGIGIATWSERGDGDKVLDTWYPVVNLGTNLGFAAVCLDALDRVGTTAGTFELDRGHIHAIQAAVAPLLDGDASHANAEALTALEGLLDSATPPTGVRRAPVLTVIPSLDTPPTDAHDVYFRLHLLSWRLVRPHGLNLEGIFGLLNNVVWTTLGPCDPEGFELLRARLRAEGHVVGVTSIDKFPRMTDYVVPTGVRIADADRVRLGAHLAEGTTVMHEGFVNFNAGTLGNAMVEGRISAGVVVGADSDVGGGASIMGTLSGGGKQTISIGERCLLGANAGLGISLGDECIVEAGLYLTAGSLVTQPDGEVVKARELSGRDGLLFRRNSRSGAIEVLARSGTWAEGLNAALHAND